VISTGSNCSSQLWIALARFQMAMQLVGNEF